MTLPTMKKFTIFYEISPNKFLEEIYNEIINLIVMLFKCRLQTQCTQTKNARYICNGKRKQKALGITKHPLIKNNWSFHHFNFFTLGGFLNFQS